LLLRSLVLRRVEWRHRQAFPETCVRRRRLQVAVDRLGEGGVPLTILVDLLHSLAGAPDAVGAREVGVEAVEAPVLLVDDDQVVDLREVLGGGAAARRARAVATATAGDEEKNKEASQAQECEAAIIPGQLSRFHAIPLNGPRRAPGAAVALAGRLHLRPAALTAP